MAVSGDFANFRAVYDDLTGEVMRASMVFLPEHLTNWFNALDTTAAVAPVIQELQAGLDFRAWRREHEVGKRLGPHKGITWPEEPEKRLGMKLLIFRAVAAGDAGYIAGLAHAYIPSSDSNIERSAKRFIDQVFRPMASELRNYLEQKASGAPAADRTVPLNHNNPDYREMIGAADELERTIAEANDFESVEEKGQRVAEVSATKRLLQAARVRVAAVIELLRPLAEQVKGKLKDTLIAMVVLKFLALLGQLIGYIWTVL